MRYSASEKLEIIRLVEQSHLPVRRTLGQIGIPRSTFYRWYDQYRPAGQRRLTIAVLGLIGCGTVSPMTSARGSSPWPSTSRSSRHGSWPCASPMPSATSCRKPRFIACWRPDHQPGLHHDEGRGRVQEQDDCAEPALADRLHLPEGDWLGLVLSVNDPRRLLALHHRLEALHHDESRGRHRHFEAGSAGFRVGSGYGDACKRGSRSTMC